MWRHLDIICRKCHSHDIDQSGWFLQFSLSFRVLKWSHSKCLIIHSWSQNLRYERHSWYDLSLMLRNINNKYEGGILDTVHSISFTYFSECYRQGGSNRWNSHKWRHLKPFLPLPVSAIFGRALHWRLLIGLVLIKVKYGGGRLICLLPSFLSCYI